MEVWVDGVRQETGHGSGSKYAWKGASSESYSVRWPNTFTFKELIQANNMYGSSSGIQNLYAPYGALRD